MHLRLLPSPRSFASPYYDSVGLDAADADRCRVTADPDVEIGKRPQTSRMVSRHAVRAARCRRSTDPARPLRARKLWFVVSSGDPIGAICRRNIVEICSA